MSWHDDGECAAGCCGDHCKGITRSRYCSDRMCGAGDCSTCYGDGVDHDDCEQHADCCDCCAPCEGCDDGDCPDCVREPDDDRDEWIGGELVTRKA